MLVDNSACSYMQMLVIAWVNYEMAPAGQLSFIFFLVSALKKHWMCKKKQLLEEPLLEIYCRKRVLHAISKDEISWLVENESTQKVFFKSTVGNGL